MRKERRQAAIALFATIVLVAVFACACALKSNIKSCEVTFDGINGVGEGEYDGSYTAEQLQNVPYVAYKIKAEAAGEYKLKLGYIISGDPTYITSYNSARSMICRLERDEILEELVKVYIETKLQ